MADWNCQRCRREGPRLPFQPWPGKVGAEVLEKICDVCWREWIGMQTKIINEYRLNALEPEHAKLLREQMRQFLGLASGDSTSQLPTP